jgi:hypothetical protein
LTQIGIFGLKTNHLATLFSTLPSASLRTVEKGDFNERFLSRGAI